MIVQALNLQPFKLPNFSWPTLAFFILKLCGRMVILYEPFYRLDYASERYASSLKNISVIVILYFLFFCFIKTST